MRKYKGFASLLLVLIAIVFAVTPVLAGSTWVKTRISLKATDNEPLASGKAIFRDRDLGLRRKLNVEVQDVISATSVNVIVDGETVGSITLVAGTGELELDTNDGDTVPFVFAGTLVKIKNVSNGDVLLKGRN